MSEGLPSPLDIARRIESIADRLVEYSRQDGELGRLPSSHHIGLLLKQLRFLLYPSYYSKRPIDSLHFKFDHAKVMAEVYEGLSEEIEAALRCPGRCPDDVDDPQTYARTVSFGLVEGLPHLREQLNEDLEAVQQHDPAATDRAEVVLAYPGFEALLVYRIAHALHQKQVPLIPRIMTETIHRDTGIDIHPGANISPRVSIDHGTGLIIGETSIIGKNVALYHNVTLGARSVSPEFRGKKRHPTIGDNVVIYPGATILGDIEVGSGSVIGGNTFLLESCPPNTKIYTKPPEMIQRKK